MSLLKKKSKEFSDSVGDFWHGRMLPEKNVKTNVMFSSCSQSFLLLEQYYPRTGAFSYSSPEEVVEIVTFLTDIAYLLTGRTHCM